ncbi:MAG: tol-pal system YbgF family protein [Akkermansiaceae bacterium]
MMLLLLPTIALAQGLNFSEADKALKAKQWAKAEAEYERQMAPYLTRCGSPMVAKFGPVYFKKGWSEMKQDKWKEAMLSFETCYKKYPAMWDNPNRCHNKALRYWAEAAYQAGDCETAARLYRKYLTETNNY